jgi:hypothetical protein
MGSVRRIAALGRAGIPSVCILPAHPDAPPTWGPVAFVLETVSPRLGQQMRDWVAENNVEVELAYTPFYELWLNRSEAQFRALRYFTLAGTDHPDHATQARLIRRYIALVNVPSDRRLRHLIKRRTLPDAPLGRISDGDRVDQGHLPATVLTMEQQGCGCREALLLPVYVVGLIKNEGHQTNVSPRGRMKVAELRSDVRNCPLQLGKVRLEGGAPARPAAGYLIDSLGVVSEYRREATHVQRVEKLQEVPGLPL